MQVFGESNNGIGRRCSRSERAAPRDSKVLILSDSQAANSGIYSQPTLGLHKRIITYEAATKEAGRRGKARTRDLKWVVNEISRR